jgi:hypothetical protein
VVVEQEVNVDQHLINCEITSCNFCALTSTTTPTSLMNSFKYRGIHNTFMQDVQYVLEFINSGRYCL